MFLLTSSSLCQERAMVWYFGDHSGINFSSGEPEVLTDGTMIAEAGCASICDEDGNLLFYTNGNKVWNRNHQIMTNGDTLNGSQLVNQNSIIIPKPLSDSIYYLFTLNNYDTLRGLNYSLIDMEGGLGRIVDKNIQISINVLEKIAAVEHCNKKDYWVITHGLDNDFYSYLVTDISSVSDSVKSIVGTKPKADIGYLKVSPSGNNIVLPVNNEDVLAEIFTFDNRTGIIDQPIKIYSKHSHTYSYGIEFSPDGNMLYVGTGGSSYDIWQYDLRKGNEETLNNEAIHIASGNNYAMQLAPNGKIYIASENRPFLNSINKPNQIGNSCEYEMEAVKFDQSSSTMGLPNFVQSWLYQPSFDVKNTCYLDTTIFTFSQDQSVDSLNWEITDLSNSTVVNYTGNNILEVFQDTGKYNVDLKIFHCGNVEAVNMNTEIFPYPISNLIPDTSICNNCSLTLDAGPDFDSYLWSTGSRSRFSTIYNTGVYSVEIGKDGCYSKDSIAIISIMPVIMFPNAFTPNGDGINDEFKAVISDNIINYSIWIQSRNGELVYSSNNVFEGWNGKHNGKLGYCETYVWTSQYSYYNENGKLKNESEGGLVTILR